MKMFKITLICLSFFVGGIVLTSFVGETGGVVSDVKPQGGSCNCPLKYVQLWITDDIEQQLVIPGNRYLACGDGLLACIDDPRNRLQNLDIHVQVWHESNSTPGVWYLMTQTIPGSGLVGGSEINIGINPATGDMTITTYNTSGNYRIVVLG